MDPTRMPSSVKVFYNTMVSRFSCSVVSNSLWLHGLQHTRTPYPSPTPRVYPLMSIVSLMPSNHLILCCFFSCPQSFPATGSFPMSQFFPSGGQSNGVSASTSVLPMNTQDWSPLGWTGWTLFAVQGTLKCLVEHHSSKASILRRSAFFIVQLSHLYMTTGKTTALTSWTFICKVMSLLLNMISRLVITFFQGVSIF